MFKKSIFTVLAAILAVSFIGCGDDGSSSSSLTHKTPSTFTVNVPKSLTTTPTKGPETGYSMLTQFTSIMEDEAQCIKGDFVMIDALYYSIKSKVDSGASFPISGLTVRFNDEILNAILECVPEEFKEEVKNELAPEVGKDLPAPTITEFKENLSGEYTNLISYTDTEAGETTECTFKWNAAKTKVMVSCTYKGISDECSYQFVYDGSLANKKMTYVSNAKFNGYRSYINITMQETGSKNGVNLSVQAKSGSNAIIINGEADDNGGYIEIKDNGGSTTTFSFNSDGNETAASSEYQISSDLTKELTLTSSASLSEGSYIIVTGEVADTTDQEAFLMTAVGAAYVDSSNAVVYGSFYGSDVNIISSCKVYKCVENSDSTVSFQLAANIQANLK